MLGHIKCLILPILALFSLTQGCDVKEAEDSQTQQVLVGKRWSWNRFRFETPILFSFSPVLHKDGRTAGRCWYANADHPNPESPQFVEEFFTNATLLTENGTIDDGDIMAAARRNQALHTAAMAAELATGKVACSEAAIGVTVMTSIPALTSALLLPTAGAIFACSLTGLGILDATNGIHRNQQAAAITGRLSDSFSMAVTRVDGDGLWRMQDAIQNLYRDKHFKPAFCPKPNELAHVLKKL